LSPTPLTNQAGEAKKVAPQIETEMKDARKPTCRHLLGLITAVGYRILDGQDRLTLAEDTESVEGEIKLVGQDVFCLFGVQ
jgi:hypothetical protein